MNTCSQTGKLLPYTFLHNPIARFVLFFSFCKCILCHSSGSNLLKAKTWNLFSSVLACHGIQKVRRENLERRWTYFWVWRSQTSMKSVRDINKKKLLKKEKLKSLRFEILYWLFLLVGVGSTLFHLTLRWKQYLLLPKKFTSIILLQVSVLTGKLMQAQHADPGWGADDLGKLLHGVHLAGGAHILFQLTVNFVVFHS